MKKIILSAILGCGLMGNVLAQGDAEAKAARELGMATAEVTREQISNAYFGG